MAKKMTIMVVEDEEDIRLNVQSLLELHDYDVITANNGLEGYNRIKRLRPNLIISDIVMPISDGYDMLIKLRLDPELRLIPVIFLTAKVMQESKIKALECGADDYLTKPFHADELALKVGNLLKSRSILITSVLQQPDKIQGMSDAERFLADVKGVLEENIQNTDLSMSDLASSLAVSQSSLQKKLKKYVNKSVSRYIREYRLKRARDMIELGYGNLGEVADKTGFRSLSYFSTTFKDFFGQTPSEMK